MLFTTFEATKDAISKEIELLKNPVNENLLPPWIEPKKFNNYK